MLRVPLLRQPDRTSCFPTAVLSVLWFQGYEVEFEELAEACGLAAIGTLQERALHGLLDAGYDVAVLTEFDERAIKALIESERPPIVTIENDPRGPFGHAVVVCAIDEETLTVMDPALGAYQELPLRDVTPLIGRGITGVVVVGGSRAVEVGA